MPDLEVGFLSSSRAFGAASADARARAESLQSSVTEPRSSRPPREPQELLCPITHIMFRDPVIVPEAGRTFEREGIESFWLKSGRVVDPLSNRALKRRELFTNWDKRGEVQAFLDQHLGYVPAGWEDRVVPSALQDMEEGDACGVSPSTAPASASASAASATGEPRSPPLSCPSTRCLERRPILRRLLLLLVATLLLSNAFLLFRLQLEHMS